MWSSIWAKGVLTRGLGSEHVTTSSPHQEPGTDLLLISLMVDVDLLHLLDFLLGRFWVDIMSTTQGI